MTIYPEMVVGRLGTSTGNQGQRTQESGGIREMPKLWQVAPAKGLGSPPWLEPLLGGWSHPRGRSLVWCQNMLAGEERERAGVHLLPLVNCGEGESGLGENCLHLFSHPEPASPTHQPRLPAFCRLSCHGWSGGLQAQMTVEQTL